MEKQEYKTFHVRVDKLKDTADALSNLKSIFNAGDRVVVTTSYGEVAVFELELLWKERDIDYVIKPDNFESTKIMPEIDFKIEPII